MQHSFARSLAFSCIFVVALGACTEMDGADVPPTREAESGATTTSTPIGLALEYKDGAGLPITVRAGQRFYLEQIDLSTSIFTDKDEGVDGLKTQGDMSGANWHGIEHEETEHGQIPDANGQFTRARFYRGAKWIEKQSVFMLVQVNAQGNPTSLPIIVDAGKDDKWRKGDHFFVRRMRAIQWTFGCPSRFDCTGASSFQEEAVVELRNALDQASQFVIHPSTVAFHLYWSQNPLHVYETPVTQDPSPPFDYGFSIDVAALTPPSPGGYYLPGQDVTFQLTLRDGAGTPLHAPGELPSYNEVAFGENDAGIQYFRAFFDPTWVFWRRKHRERTLIAHLMGPEQNVGPIRSVIPTDEILTQDVQNVATFAENNLFDQWKVFPQTDWVFGGAFDPVHADWANPGSDTWSFHLPDDALPGTYRLTVKGRRTYYGQDLAFTRTLDIQVGSATPTTATLTTGKCNTCHTGEASFAKVLHANSDRATCVGCHAPLGLEYDAPIHSRVHYIHSRSNRVDMNIKKCANCHLTKASIGFTSKAACLSCHTSYPASHVAAFGPVRDIYVGGEAESFGRCTESCHTTHPASGL